LLGRRALKCRGGKFSPKGGLAKGMVEGARGRLGRSSSLKFREDLRSYRKTNSLGF